MPTWLLAVVLALTALVAPSTAQGPPQRAKPTMLCDSTAITPGGTFTLAIRFEIDPGWHMYGPYLNDTGIAPIIDLKVPAGFEIGAPQWPVPTRYVSGDGQLLDHVYEGEFVILLPMRAPAELDPEIARGSGIEFAASMEWLVCKDICVPGWGDASVTVPVAATSEPANRAVFNEARKLVPRPLPQDDQWRAGGVPTHLAWDGQELIVRTTPGRRVIFHPLERSLAPADRFGGVTSDTGTLRVSFAGSEAPVPADARQAEGASGEQPRVVRGTIEIVNRNRLTGELGRRLAAYTVETTPPPAR